MKSHGAGRRSVLRGERGAALIGALLVSVLVTALGTAALYLSQMDLMLAGNYRVQRAAETAADGTLELVKGMVFANTPLLNLPLSVPADGTAATWSRTVSYADADIDVTAGIGYKQEDNVNFNGGEAYPDEVVRYGRDYRYEAAEKPVGKQPVYRVSVRDNRTGVKAEADLISTIGFTTPAAVFCVGRVHMQKYQWATEETIEMASGSGTPAVATASASAANITIETVREGSAFSGGTTTVTAAAAANAATLNVGSTAGFPNASQVIVKGALVSYAGKNATQFTGCTGVPAVPAGTFVTRAFPGNQNYTAVNPTANNQYAVDPSYLHPRVFRPSEVDASKTAGLYNQARDIVHILLGTGSDRNADLDAAFAAAGGGAAGAAAANALFRFYNPSADSASSAYDVPVAFDNTVTPHQCAGVVCFNYGMPAAQAPLTQLETMFGQSFADLKSLADADCDDATPGAQPCDMTCTSTVTLPTGGSSNFGCNLSGMSLGTEASPKVVYINGTGNASAVTLVTDSGTRVRGAGILVVDDDLDVVGSIDWKGLMLIKGDLTFRPWQGGTAAVRSGPDLQTEWKGFIIVGGDLDLWTYWGGSIVLGYTSNDVASIKGIISRTVPHKVLAWRRAYH